HQSPGDGPLLTMPVMHQHHRRRLAGGAGEERDAVLGVDHGVGPDAAQRSEAEAAEGDGGERARVYRVPAAGPADVDAVDGLAPRRAWIEGGAQGDFDAPGGEVGADLLEVAFAAPTLRMPRVAPAEQ